MNVTPGALFARFAAKGLQWRHLLWPLYVGFAWWCVTALWADMRKIPWGSIFDHAEVLLLAGALPWVNHLLRTVRWQVYLRQAGLQYPFLFTAQTYLAGFAFTISPGKVGEMIRARYYVARGATATSIHGAFFTERLLDLLVMICLAAMATTAIANYQSLVWLALALVVGLLTLVALVPWSRLQGQLAGRAQRAWHGAAQGLCAALVSAKAFIRPPVLASTFALSLASWGAEAAGFMVLVNGLGGGALDYPTAAGIYAAAIIVGALSFLPGGLGSTEAVLVALLVSSGLALPQAMLVTIVWRFLTLWAAVAAGWLCVAALAGSTRTNKDQ